MLNVGVAHIGEFGSVDAIAAAKGELVEALPADGVAILNADDPRVRAMAGRTAASVVLVGEAADADVRAEDVTLDDRGRASYTLVTRRGRPASAGRARTASGVQHADRGGGRVDRRMSRSPRWRPGCPNCVWFPHEGWMSSTAPTVSRSSTTRTTPTRRRRRPRCTRWSRLGAGRRRIAVLGYLAELGDHETVGHEEVGALAATLGVDRLIVVGEPAEPIHQGAQSVPGWRGTSVAVPDQDRAIELLGDRSCERVTWSW